MTRKRLAFWSFLVAVLLLAPSAFAGTLQELAAKAKLSVVLLTISDSSGRKVGTGTGFFISSDGRVATNHHVIAGAAKVTASLSDGRKIDALGVLAEDEEKDLAILQLPGEGFPALTLGESRTLRAGDEIVVFGSPMGLSGTLSAGIVSAIRDEHALEAEKDDEDPPGKKERSTKSWGIQVTAAISPGSSGSPIMTQTGEVVAVAVGRLVGGENLNFGIPVEELKTLLLRAGPGAKPKAFAQAASSDVRMNLIISAAFFGAIALIYFGFRRYERNKARRRSAPPRPRPS